MSSKRQILHKCQVLIKFRKKNKGKAMAGVGVFVRARCLHKKSHFKGVTFEQRELALWISIPL